MLNELHQHNPYVQDPARCLPVPVDVDDIRPGPGVIALILPGNAAAVWDGDHWLLNRAIDAFIWSQLFVEPYPARAAILRVYRMDCLTFKAGPHKGMRVEYPITEQLLTQLFTAPVSPVLASILEDAMTVAE